MCVLDDTNTWSLTGSGCESFAEVHCTCLHGLRGAVGMVSYAHPVYVTCYFCHMLSLGPSSGSIGSVRIYRSVMRTLHTATEASTVHVRGFVRHE